jgi:hypothetical protein
MSMVVHLKQMYGCALKTTDWQVDLGKDGNFYNLTYISIQFLNWNATLQFNFLLHCDIGKYKLGWTLNLALLKEFKLLIVDIGALEKPIQSPWIFVDPYPVKSVLILNEDQNIVIAVLQYFNINDNAAAD